MKIYLIRHGKIEWCKEKAYIGKMDIPLSQEGVLQSKKLRAHFEKISIDRAYTSPSKRCVKTLDSAFKGRAFDKIVDEDLKEINMGKWEGLTFSEVKKSYPKEYEKRGREIFTYTTPEGESFFNLKQRVIPAFKKIMGENSEKTVVIMTHSGVIRVILAEVFGLPENELFRWSIPYAGVCELCCDPEKDRWMAVINQ